MARTKASYGGGRPQVRWDLAGWYLYSESDFTRPDLHTIITYLIMSWHIMYFSGTKVRFDDFRKESRILDTSEMATTSPFKTLSSMSI